jgi:hypothetical protein
VACYSEQDRNRAIVWPRSIDLTDQVRHAEAREGECRLGPVDDVNAVAFEGDHESVFRRCPDDGTTQGAVRANEKSIGPALEPPTLCARNHRTPPARRVVR